jgi:hypothetical protein
MKRYLAFDGINGDREEFDTIEEAREWLEDCFLSPDEGYHPDFASCKIYQLAETVECEVVDKKENYKYIYEDDIPEGDNESQAWPYSTDFDEIWKHKFVPVPSELLRQRDELREAFNQMRQYWSLIDSEADAEQIAGSLWEVLAIAEAAIKNTETK